VFKKNELHNIKYLQINLGKKMEYLYVSNDISKLKGKKTMFQLFEIDNYDNEFEKSVNILIPGFGRHLHNGGNTIYRGFLDDDVPDGAMYKYILENRYVPYYAAITGHIALLKHQLLFSKYGDFNANHEIIGKGNIEVLLMVNSKIKNVDEFDIMFSINCARLNVFKCRIKLIITS
jgi:hypothetical protein